MAKDVNIQFSGRIGPLVGCLRYGKYHYRSRPGKVNQTKATKCMSNYFGLAAKAGKIMRLYLAASIPNAKDIHMQRRLENCIGKWLRSGNVLPPKPTADMPFVNHFNFDEELRLEEKLKINLSFKQTGTDTTELQLPAYVPVEAVKAPAGTTHLEFCISAVALRLGDDNCHGSYNHTITTAYDETLQDVQQLVVPLKTNPGNILVAAMQVRYGLQEAGGINYHKFKARHTGAIAGAICL